MASDPSLDGLAMEALSMGGEFPSVSASLPVRLTPDGQRFATGQITGFGPDGITLESGLALEKEARVWLETALGSSGELLGLRAKVVTVGESKSSEPGRFAATVKPVGLSMERAQAVRAFLDEYPGSPNVDEEGQIAWTLVSDREPFEGDTEGLYVKTVSGWVEGADDPGLESGRSLDFYRGFLDQAVTLILAGEMGPVALAYRGKRMSPQEGVEAHVFMVGLTSEEGSSADSETLAPAGRALVQAQLAQLRLVDELAAAGWRSAGVSYDTLWDLDECKEVLQEAAAALESVKSTLTPEVYGATELQGPVDNTRLRLIALGKTVAQVVCDSRASLALAASKAGVDGFEQAKSWLAGVDARTESKKDEPTGARAVADEDDDDEEYEDEGPSRILLAILALVVVGALGAGGWWWLDQQAEAEPPPPIDVRAEILLMGLDQEFGLSQIEVDGKRMEAVVSDWLEKGVATRAVFVREVCDRVRPVGAGHVALFDPNRELVAFCLGEKLLLGTEAQEAAVKAGIIRPPTDATAGPVPGDIDDAEERNLEELGYEEYEDGGGYLIEEEPEASAPTGDAPPADDEPTEPGDG